MQHLECCDEKIINKAWGYIFSQEIRPLSSRVIQVGWNPHVAELVQKKLSPIYHLIIPSNSESGQAVPQRGDRIVLCQKNFSIDKERQTAKYQGTVIIKEGETLLNDLRKTFPDIESKRYSDEDIQEFYQLIDPSAKNYLALFFYELREREQITQKQYEMVTKIYELEEPTKEIGIKQECALAALQLCLQKYMTSGSELIWCGLGSVSYYENPWFFEEVITNPGYDYHEEMFEIDGERVLCGTIRQL